MFNVVLNGIMIKSDTSIEYYRLKDQSQEFDFQQTQHDNQIMFVARQDALQIEEYGRTVEEVLTGVIERLSGRLKTALNPDPSIKIVSDFDKIYLGAFIKSEPFPVIFYPIEIDAPIPSSSSSAPITSSSAPITSSSAPIPFSSSSAPITSSSSSSTLDTELLMLRSNMQLLKKVISHMAD